MSTRICDATLHQQAKALLIFPQCRIYASVKQVSIGSDNGLPPIRHQDIVWTRAGLLSIRPLGTNFSEILIKVQNFSFTKKHLKILSAKWWPFCPGEDELTNVEQDNATWGPFYWHGLTLIWAWISHYIHYKVWDEISYPFPNFHGATIEVWEWMNNFIPHFTGQVITYPCWN